MSDPRDPVEETTRGELRIVSRSPDEDVWRFVPFTGSRPKNVKVANDRIERAREESPGWDFRLESREVTTTTTAWEDWSSVQPIGGKR